MFSPGLLLLLFSEVLLMHPQCIVLGNTEAVTLRVGLGSKASQESSISEPFLIRKHVIHEGFLKHYDRVAHNGGCRHEISVIGMLRQ